MKRYGNLYKDIIELDNIYDAYLKARKGKGWQRTVKNVENDLENRLALIQDMLVNKTYKVSPYRTKVIYEPKQRLIYKLPFYPDRIIQHAIINVLSPIWESFFIKDSYASRPGKGIHACSTRTMEFIRRNKYCLKCDISKFYPSIDHEVLYSIIAHKIKDKDVLWLLRQIIDTVEGGKNCPIGNFTSQWFGNLYLNELDQQVKHVYRVKDYIRYCDDFLLFSNSKQALKGLLAEIEGFVDDHLKMTLSKKDLFPTSRGVDFVGYRHFRNYILLRKSTAKRVKKRIKQLPILHKTGQMSLEQCISSLSSTEGWMKWANCYNFRKALDIEGIREEINSETI
jgi:RNA-directed DNA polymerase